MDKTPIRHGPWTILRTSEKYSHDTLTVNEDQVIRPDGHTGVFVTVKMPSGVSVLAIDDDGFVYLTREFRYALGIESVETTGGVIEEGEDPETAAARELKEELGIQAEEFTYLGCINPITSIMSSPNHLFLARRLQFREKNPDGGEEIATVKMRLEDCVKMVIKNDITHAESCALILKAFVQERMKDEVL